MNQPARKPQRDAQRQPARTWNRSTQVVDRFHIDKERIPAGQDYQWIAASVMGQPNTRELVNMQRNYWIGVPASRHPELFGEGVEGVGMLDGMMLVERAMEISEEAREEDRQAARAQMGNQLERLDQVPAGTFERRTGSGGRAVSVERGRDLAVPEDAELG